MTTTQFSQSLFAGFFFVLWPILIKRSNINEYASPFMMSVIVSLFCLPFAVIMARAEYRSVVRWIFPVVIFLVLLAVTMGFPSSFASRLRGFNAGVEWTYVVSAALASAAGLAICNTMIAKASQAQLGLLICIMTVVQFTGTALYYMLANGDMSVKKAVGFTLAIISTFFLKGD